MSHHVNEEILEQTYDMGFEDGYNQAIVDIRKKHMDDLNFKLTDMFNKLEQERKQGKSL